MLHEILVMCVFQIDPKMDKFYCIDHMVSCTEKSDFQSCSDYWQPLANNKNEFLEDVASNNEVNF